jgi:hypothetical protein
MTVWHDLYEKQYSSADLLYRAESFERESNNDNGGCSISNYYEMIHNPLSRDEKLNKILEQLRERYPAQKILSFDK